MLTVTAEEEGVCDGKCQYRLTGEERKKKLSEREKAFYLKSVSLIHRINAYSTAHEGISVTLFAKCLPH